MYKIIIRLPRFLAPKNVVMYAEFLRPENENYGIWGEY